MNTLKIPSERDVTHTLPDINNWHKFLNMNLCFERGDNTKDLRNEIIGEALKYTKCLPGIQANVSYNSPVIGTGHQATWHHCGILAKDIVSEAFSRSLKSTNVHIVLDHDIQDSLINLPISDKTNDSPNSFTPEAKIPLEFRDFNTGLVDISKYPQNAFCRRWKKDNILAKASEKASFPDATTYLQGILKSRLGIKPLYLPVSKICQTRAFEIFLANILRNSDNFIQIYNNAILNLSRHNSNVARSIKTLQTRDGNRINLPFWISTSTGKRHNCWITSNKHMQNIYADNEYVCKFISDKNILKEISSQGYYIRPKAITLMLFLRLYLFDWFIHGIGGGKYETITDYILKHFYNEKNTYYGVVSLTSTLLEDKNLLCQSNKKVEKLISLSRKMRSNPERFHTPKAPSDHFKQLKLNKQMAINALNDSDATKAHKGLLFKEINSINSKLLSYISDKYADVLSELNEERSVKSQLEISDRRDYFFGLFPEERLANIVNGTLEHECFKQTNN